MFHQILAGFAALSGLIGMGVWSQLTIGWQWAAPADAGTRAAMWLMTGALAGLAGLALLALLIAAPAVARELARPARRRVLVPLGVTLVAGAVLYLGCDHFGAGWPGTGGHAWPGRGLVPGWAARLAWAATLWVSAYWAHPEALRGFPAGEVMWMALTPIAWLTLFAGAVTAARRVPITVRLRRAARVLCACAVALMGVFLAGAGSWVLSGGPGPRDLFAVGLVDVLALGLMLAALLAAAHLLGRVGPSPRAARG